jgi:hypothetical protein
MVTAITTSATRLTHIALDRGARLTSALTVRTGDLDWAAGVSETQTPTCETRTIGVGLATHLCPAHAASVVVLVTVRQDQEELFPNRVCLLAAGAEQTRRLKLAEPVYNVRILDHNGIIWAVRASQPSSPRDIPW